MKILAVALLTAFPAQAEVEKFLLSEHKAWSVYFNSREDGTSFCSAEVTNFKDVFFSIDVSEEKLEAWYIASNNDFGPKWVSGAVSLTIDNNRPWSLPAHAKGTFVVMENITYGFLMEIFNGINLRVDLEGDGASEAWFSLQGSADALVSLVDCSEKIGVVL